MSSTKAETADKNTRALARGVVGRVQWIGDCRPETLDELVACGQLRKYGKGECVAQRDQAFDFMGVLIKGSLEASFTRPWGHRHLVGILRPGTLVGLVPTMDGLGHVNDLWSREPSTVLLIPRDDVRRIRDADPALARALERHLAFRCRLLFDRLIADSGLSLEARLCNLLLTLCSLHGSPRGNVVELDLKLSQTDLADWLGVSRQRINFVVKQLQAADILELRYFAITIVDYALLVERAADPLAGKAPNPVS
ncbi:Crp/Fnr family transcriptional regulator [Paraburkholderia pallida]|uniref:Crp/Fnr family transcriptional regulator n=1 Tax=Paraburkholderia pallida TaxID=2547399 RepID=A0A4V1B0W9_9BURK|nr:Crp/Fnr family transcriptional regulator [Paraburkholderia pallida]QBR04233.1 Crp/Fnr family transcriptional regulator [Paraburkholderia pallida]